MSYHKTRLIAYWCRRCRAYVPERAALASRARVLACKHRVSWRQEPALVNGRGTYISAVVPVDLRGGLPFLAREPKA